MLSIEKKGARGVRRVSNRITREDKDVPGPSVNPATNLLIADLAIRAGSTLVRRAVEKGILRTRYDREQAHKIVENRSLTKTLATVAVSKFATKSVPGAATVAGALALKTLFDRSRSRHKAKRAGDKALSDQARDD